MGGVLGGEQAQIQVLNQYSNVVMLNYYGSSDPAFIEFLSTLGLRNYNNTDNPAWLQLLEETQIRGWKCS
jgi:hypothetical protein